MRSKAQFFSLIVFIFLLQTVLVSKATAATRIMPLGDGITQGANSGEGLEVRQVSYRKALWDKLIDAGYDVDFVGSLNSGSALFADGDHEGHSGWTDDEIVNGNGFPPADGKLNEWLAVHQPDVVLLHIGTNDVDPDPDQVEDILNVIDTYSTDTWVILALIIKRSCDPYASPCPGDVDTTAFNDAVLFMANGRAGDKIVIVDMEDGAGIDYREQPTGDMWDDLHPFQYGIGYAKMADEWFSALEQILPDPKPDANFTANPISGVSPLSVNFTDQSTGIITSWSWDFGDNSTSTNQSPTHTYNDPGTYSVELTVSGPGGTDTETKADYIVVEHETPVANFTADNTIGDAPLTVNFSDESTGDITNWLWDFGDDETSTEENPTHTYTDEGIYTISLFVSGPHGSDTEVKLGYITVSEPDDDDGDGGGGGGCFIATSANGPRMAK